MYVTNLQEDSGIRAFPQCFCLQKPVFEVYITLPTFLNQIDSSKACTQS